MTRKTAGRVCRQAAAGVVLLACAIGASACAAAKGPDVIDVPVVEYTPQEGSNGMVDGPGDVPVTTEAPRGGGVVPYGPRPSSVPADFPTVLVPLPGADELTEGTWSYSPDGDLLGFTITYTGAVDAPWCSSYFARFAGAGLEVRSQVTDGDVWTLEAANAQGPVAAFVECAIADATVTVTQMGT